MILNCDYVIASENAKFALPEVKRGVIAVQGGESTFDVYPISDHFLRRGTLDFIASLSKSIPLRMTWLECSVSTDELERHAIGLCDTILMFL